MSEPTPERVEAAHRFAGWLRPKGAGKYDDALACCTCGERFDGTQAWCDHVCSVLRAALSVSETPQDDDTFLDYVRKEAGDPEAMARRERDLAGLLGVSGTPEPERCAALRRGRKDARCVGIKGHDGEHSVDAHRWSDEPPPSGVSVVPEEPR